MQHFKTVTNYLYSHAIIPLLLHKGVCLFWFSVAVTPMMVTPPTKLTVTNSFKGYEAIYVSKPHLYYSTVFQQTKIRVHRENQK